MSDDQRVHRKNASQEFGEKSQESQERVSTHRSGHRHSDEQKIRVALVHDWLNGMRGGEIVFEAILDLYPGADVYTLFYEPQKLSQSLVNKLSHGRVYASFLNRFWIARRFYRHLLPFLPFVIRSFRLRGYDLVLSSSHCVAKGIRIEGGTPHLSYVHAPMRYMWDRFEDYFGKHQVSLPIRWIAKLCRPFLQYWDKKMASPKQVTQFVANSRFIAEQIKTHYERQAEVVYPFARLERFEGNRSPAPFYLMVGAFAPYKKTDLAIRAFARMGLPLKIVGSGQDEQRLKELKVSLPAPSVEFIESPTNLEIEKLYSQCRGFVFPGKEDFGITPLEALASGAPVIAFAEGGASETVTLECGVLFREQTIDALVDAVMEIESGRKAFSEEACRQRARYFSESRFKNELKALLSLI